MIIKPVAPNEIMDVKELLSRVWKETYGKYYSPEAIEKITSSWHAPEKLLQQVKDPNTYFATAKLDNHIVGIITVRKNRDGSLFMTRIYVDPYHQGKHIGSMLMDSAWNHFPEARIMRLECEKQNGKACAFYLKNGFKPTAEIVEVVEGVRMTTVEYQKNLDAP